MNFEITYQNATKVIVTVPDPEVRAWLDGRAKRDAVAVTEKSEIGRGAPVSCKVV